MIAFNEEFQDSDWMTNVDDPAVLDFGNCPCLNSRGWGIYDGVKNTASPHGILAGPKTAFWMRSPCMSPERSVHSTYFPEIFKRRFDLFKNGEGWQCDARRPIKKRSRAANQIIRRPRFSCRATAEERLIYSEDDLVSKNNWKHACSAIGGVLSRPSSPL